MFLNFFNNNDVFKKDSKKTPTRLGRKNFGMHIFNLFFLAIYGSFLPKPSFQKNEKSIKFHLPLFWMFSIFFSAVFDLSGIWSMVFRNDFFQGNIRPPVCWINLHWIVGGGKGGVFWTGSPTPMNAPKSKKHKEVTRRWRQRIIIFCLFFTVVVNFPLNSSAPPGVS